MSVTYAAAAGSTSLSDVTASASSRRDRSLSTEDRRQVGLRATRGISSLAWISTDRNWPNAGGR
jgi:uncharacterized protein (UPF0147 family)